MKIAIDKGISVNALMEFLNGFFENECSEFTQTRQRTNLYVSLENEGQESCPLNDRDYRISDDGIHDIYAEKQAKALDAFETRWSRVKKNAVHAVEEAKWQLEKDDEWLANAEQQGRNQSVIKGRRTTRAKHETRLAELQETYDLVIELDKRMAQHKIKVKCIKLHEGRRPYDYDVEAVFSFENIKKKSGYFYQDSLVLGQPWWDKNTAK